MRRFIISLWLILGLAYWYLANYHCQSPGTIPKEDLTALPKEIIDKNSEIVKSKKPQKLSPIAFDCSSSDPTFEPQWSQFRDSIISTLNDERILQIKGLAFKDESSSSGSNLGLERAQVIGNQFNLEEDKIRFIDGTKEDNCTSDEKYNFLVFKSLLNTSKIKEIDDRTIIYFLFNSTQKLNDSEVENYLNDVAARIIKSGEMVRITGHTDNNGEEVANLRLGQARADIIKFYLLSKGVDPSSIEALSKGESNPIRDNGSGEGRASNRRAELEILPSSTSK